MVTALGRDRRYIGIQKINRVAGRGDSPPSSLPGWGVGSLGVSPALRL